VADIENFKDKIHTLSNAERIKGGRVSSPKKTLANSLNNLQHGKYSRHLHTLLHCSECPYSYKCAKKRNGYCVYLIQDLKKDNLFRKMIIDKRIKRDSNDLVPFVVAKYSLQKEYIKMLKKHFR